jgi:hypothetical protein
MRERLRTAEALSWCVERDGVLVVPARGEGRLLEGLEAVAWELLARGNDFDAALRKLCIIGRIGRLETERRYRTWMKRWQSDGWLTSEAERG